MANQNKIDFKNYIYILYIYRYLIISIYTLFGLFFFTLGNLNVSHGLYVTFTFKNSQIEKIINNSILLENIFDLNLIINEKANFNKQVFKNEYYQLLEARLLVMDIEDFIKSDLSFEKSQQIVLSNNSNQNNASIIFLSSNEELIDKLSAVKIKKNIINFFKKNFINIANDKMYFVNSFLELDLNSIRTKLESKKKQLNESGNLIYDKNLVIFYKLQNDIIELEIDLTNTLNNFSLIEKLNILINKNINDFNSLSNFSVEKKSFYNDLILRALLFFLSATLFLLVLILILNVIKEE